MSEVPPQKKSAWHYGWIMVPLAALAMAATLPGRTHGLGLITKPLLEDFPSLSQESFARINGLATLLGAAFCLPCGWLIDRVGLKHTVGGTILALGLVIYWLTLVHDETQLAIALTLTRGVGQSMLSIVSITMVGKWFSRNVGIATGVFAVLMSLLMAVSFGVVGARVQTFGWRGAWQELAWGMMALAPLCWLATRNAPQANSDHSSAGARKPMQNESSATWLQALGSPCFWVFAGAISLFGMATSGISLFQQFILESRGLNANVFLLSGVIGLLTGMIANLAFGGLARVLPLHVLLAAAMSLLTVSLGMLPIITAAWHAYAFAVIHGIAGGGLTVLFFAIWGQAFGSAHLGRIQSAAQMLTVFASALGPLLVADSQARSASYGPILWLFAATSLAFAIVATLIRVPNAQAGDWNLPEPVPDLAAAES